MKNLQNYILFLTLILSSTFALSQPYQTCGTAGNLNSMTSPYSGSTAGCSNDFSFCSMGSAPDQIFYYDLPSGFTLTIGQTSNSYDSRHSLRIGGACPGTTQLVCTDDPDTQTETYTNCSGSTERVYWIQSGYSTGSGAYTLAWSVSAFSCPTCTSDMTINSTTYSNNGLTTCGFGDDYSSSDACGSSYMGGDDIVIEYTPTTTQCVSISLTNTDTWTGVFLLDNCPDISGASCLASNTNSAGNPSISSYNVVSGTTYYIVVSTFPSPQCTAFDLDISACPGPPSNDECAGAISLTVNNDLTCTSTTSGTIENSTASTDANSCGGTDDDDVWFSFVATTTTHYVDLLNVAGSVTDMYHVLYSGSCGSLTQMYCSDANSSTANGLTIGNTYYIRVYTWTSTGGQNSTFDVCITRDPPPITACSGNFYDTGGSGGPYSSSESYTQTYCSDTPGQCLVMTFSSFDTESCCDDLTIYNGADNTAPIIGTYAGSSLPNGGTITALSGCLTIEWYSDGSVEGNGWAASISCGACPAPSCSDGVQNGTETGVDCGGSCPACPVIGPCGNLNNNDFCSDPAVLTQGGGGWSSSTNPIYTADDPGTSFCGSIENNSWYVFTAIATSETFNFTNITNCKWGDGIQAEVFDVTTDANGCCTSLSSVSNCMNPGTATSGTVTASGLTIGNDYYLMVDGWGGDNCDFTVTNWSATGILPVTLVNFKGHNYKTGNKLVWTTKTEVNNDYFIIQRSKDARHFTDIGIVDGNGNSNIENNYEFIDNSFLEGINYYRLKQIDFNGDYEHSRIIVLKSINSIDVAIYPNPSSDNLYFDVSESSDEVLTVQYTNILGSTVSELISTTEGKNTYQLNNFKDLKAGIYMVQLINSNNEVIKYQKIVKK
ncbi:MAG: T9SS type A sorting domain-containing protein [Flavobacteriales bacterium]|nr:T9SS type A sorting domain-containing protein [Flavobacteriales bacterium]MCB9365119.1 T9SS type A sorting domain-containing protein [Flavobacteriales bacterium]